MEHDPSNHTFLLKEKCMCHFYQLKPSPSKQFQAKIYVALYADKGKGS
jgi:hypothetical protein